MANTGPLDVVAARGRQHDKLVCCFVSPSQVTVLDQIWAFGGGDHAVVNKLRPQLAPNVGSDPDLAEVRKSRGRSLHLSVMRPRR